MKNEKENQQPILDIVTEMFVDEEFAHPLYKHVPYIDQEKILDTVAEEILAKLGITFESVFDILIRDIS
jgi:hypothetical protein